jgi:hypothetical protein
MAYNYSYGTATNSANLLSLLNTFVVTTCGWTLHDNQSGGSPAYYVWTSAGESGKEAIYIRCTYGTTDGLVLTAYRYWDNAAHVGYQASPAYAVTTYGIWSDHDASFNYFLFGDLDRIAVVTKTVGSVYYFASFGIVTSVWSRNIAVSANSETAGSSVVIEVDITTPFTVNQYYGIVNGNNATGDYERIQVTAINPGVSITATIAGNHPAGAIIGEDPQPNYINRYSSTTSVYLIGPTGTAAQTHSLFVSGSFTPVIVTDPDARQNYTWLFPLMAYQSVAQEYRGNLKEIYATGGSNLSSEDTVTVGSDVYKCFNSSSYGWIAIKEQTV